MLEVCTFSLEDAFTAAHAGAQRLEICSNVSAGGLTGPAEWVFVLKQTLTIPLVAMARHRGGSFVYTEEDWVLTTKNAENLLMQGADAIVFGGLKADGTLNFDQCKKLNDNLGIPTVLHRAFDATPSPKDALEAAIEAGFSRILTGIGSHSMDQLQALQKQANGRIQLLPGGGIRQGNAQRYLSIGLEQLHSSAITQIGHGVNAKEVQALLACMANNQHLQLSK